MSDTVDMNEVELSVLAVSLHRLGVGNRQLAPSTEMIQDTVQRAIEFIGVESSCIDAHRLIETLVLRFSNSVSEVAVLHSDEDHIPWLTQPRKRSWRYWPRFKAYMAQRLSSAAIRSMDSSTDTTLSFLEDPERSGMWDRRGLVVGQVQSGKTGNYTALICKAADAGYKIIIVLAGLHNNLRSQTQIRLEEGFLGYQTSGSLGPWKAVGVGLSGDEHSIRPNCATTREEDGDFNARIARNLGISPEQRPWLFVVKKNRSVLKSLLTWVRHHVADRVTGDNQTPRVSRFPVLVVDDEADHASVDTGEQLFDAHGRPDPEHEPTAINRLIRQILVTFTRAAYVGYTATPFANIFIHENGLTNDDGPDLFPSAFIVNLATPETYVGPSRVFPSASAEKQRPLPLVRTAVDAATISTADSFAKGILTTSHAINAAQNTAGRLLARIPEESKPWMPVGHKSTHIPKFHGLNTLPTSLVDAIDAFLLGCAVRSFRGEGDRFASMLVHVTRFVAVQSKVAAQVADHVKGMNQRIRRGIDADAHWERLRRLWETDFVPTFHQLASEPDAGTKLPSWPEVHASIFGVLQDVRVVTINGTARDALTYADPRAHSKKIIAIGGDKLARGLTLEGLTVSYFLRASRMYDTLMQMGRWFGYRPGYLELCRLYTTSDLVDWYGNISEASDELRKEFEFMAATGKTPRQYGLKVKTHPGQLVTSLVKMRNGTVLDLSFSGTVSETVNFFAEPGPRDNNLAALKDLLHDLPPPEVNPERPRAAPTSQWSGLVWCGVDVARVLAFLDSYQTHPDARQVRSELLTAFIREMVDEGELTVWDIALIGTGPGTDRESYSLAELGLIHDIPFHVMNRTATIRANGGLSIGRLMSSRDESIVLTDGQWYAALALARSRQVGPEFDNFVPPGRLARSIRGRGFDPAIAPHGSQLCTTVVEPDRTRGLICIYLVNLRAAENETVFHARNVVGFGISFPESDAAASCRYVVNTPFQAGKS